MSQQLSGSKFGVSAAAPATFDQAGYEALTFTLADDSEILDFSGFDDDWERSEDNTYNVSPSPSKKVRPKLGEVTLMLEYLKSSTAFYGIIDTAEGSQTDVISCQFLASNGTDSLYFTAQVVKSNPKGGSGSDKRTHEIVLLPQTKRVKVEA